MSVFEVNSPTSALETQKDFHSGGIYFFFLNEKHRLEPVSKHPLLITVVGFVLTGIIGTLISFFVTEQQASKTKEENSRRERISIAENLVEDMMARRVRGELVISAIRRGAHPDEVKKRKIEYDEAYFSWNKRIGIHILRIGSFITTNDDEKFVVIKNNIETHLIKEMFTPVDYCITTAYDEYISGSGALSANEKLKKCFYSEIRSALTGCSIEVGAGILGIANDFRDWDEYSLAMNRTCIGYGYKSIVKRNEIEMRKQQFLDDAKKYQAKYILKWKE